MIAAVVVSLVLTALNKFPLLAEPTIALKHLIIITMPASMGAIIADSFDKEYVYFSHEQGVEGKRFIFSLRP